MWPICSVYIFPTPLEYALNKLDNQDMFKESTVMKRLLVISLTKIEVDTLMIKLDGQSRYIYALNNFFIWRDKWRGYGWFWHFKHGGV